MDYTSDRRNFLKAGATIAAASSSVLPLPRLLATDNKTAKFVLRLGIMGVNNRGKAIAKHMLDQPAVEIATICDVDERAAISTQKLVEKTQNAPTKVTGDFREILDDDSIDVLVCAAPNHWHAPATIMACNAGKHVYVEKPCSYTAEEGEWAIQAARKNNRVVGMGTQRRSWLALVQGIAKVHDGAIGETLYARTWYNNRRKPIGNGKAIPAPGWLDWDLWQGPAPRKKYKDNIVHYKWHWQWHWGNGELGNNGVHGIDVARWAMNVTYPESVSASGGRIRFDDDQQTPDTMMVSMNFSGGKMITWEGLSWSPLGPHDTSFGISIHGTDGSMVIRDSGYTIFDMKNKEVESQSGPSGDADHFADFLDAVRTGRRPNADIEIAHQSTLLCHLGNIAYRTGAVLKTDPTNGHIIGNQAAEALWGREYEEGWRPVV
jgi:predicted dehydrogenase